MSRCAGTDERGLQHYARSIEAIVARCCALKERQAG